MDPVEANDQEQILRKAWHQQVRRVENLMADLEGDGMAGWPKQTGDTTEDRINRLKQSVQGLANLYVDVVRHQQGERLSEDAIKTEARRGAR